MRDLKAAIPAGNRLHRALMRLDQEKANLSRVDIEGSTTALFSQFAADAGLRFHAAVRFCDTLDLRISQTSPETCFVEVDGGRCSLHFDETILARPGESGAMDFVARSWAPLLVLETALARGLSFCGNFLLTTGDGGGLDAVAFSSNNPDACLICDFEFLLSGGYRRFHDQYARAPAPWVDRGDKVFWRGATTGWLLKDAPKEGEDDDLSWLQRLRLCVAAKDPKIAEACDIGVSQIVQVRASHLRENIRNANIVKDRVERLFFSRQKYVIDIDGNSNAWSGLFCSLIGGSCVLKVASMFGFRQWYYDSLQPWLNYVPVLADLSDFAAKVDWVRRNDREAEQIARRGQELAASITLENALEASAGNLHAWLARRSAAL